MTAKVFISAGTPANDAQRQFRDTVIKSVETAGLTPRVMTDKDWDYRNPLRGLRRAMEGCTGAVVVAYTRYKVDTGTEVRSDESKSINESIFPTAWNQIEAAMAYEKEMPLFVVAQTGIKKDAIFEDSSDIKPFWTDLDPQVCNSDGFIGYLQSWKLDVEKNAQRVLNDKNSVDKKINLVGLFNSLSWNEGLALIGSLIGLILSALTVGYRLGSGEWPF